MGVSGDKGQKWPLPKKNFASLEEQLFIYRWQVVREDFPPAFSTSVEEVEKRGRKACWTWDNRSYIPRSGREQWLNGIKSEFLAHSFLRHRYLILPYPHQLIREINVLNNSPYSVSHLYIFWNLKIWMERVRSDAHCCYIPQTKSQPKREWYRINSARTHLPAKAASVACASGRGGQDRRNCGHPCWKLPDDRISHSYHLRISNFSLDFVYTTHLLLAICRKDDHSVIEISKINYWPLYRRLVTCGALRQVTSTFADEVAHPCSSRTSKTKSHKKEERVPALDELGAETEQNRGWHGSFLAQPRIWSRWGSFHMIIVAFHVPQCQIPGL